PFVLFYLPSFALYLYTVNRQIGYITSAHLILFSIAAGYFFISKISTAPDSPDHVNAINVIQEPVLSAEAKKGKALFTGNCGSCHNVFKIIVGPALAGFEDRGPWSDRTKLYKWIRHPEIFIKTDPYTQELQKKFKSLMNPSAHLTDEEIDFIVAYIKETEKTAV